MPIPVTLEKELNKAIVAISQRQHAAKQREAAQSLIDHLQEIILQLNNILQMAEE